MKHDTYSIESMHGQAMREGLQNTLENVLAPAQQDADDLAEPVFVYNQDGDEWEVEPKCVCEREGYGPLRLRGVLIHKTAEGYVFERCDTCGRFESDEKAREEVEALFEKARKEGF